MIRTFLALALTFLVGSSAIAETLAESLAEMQSRSRVYRESLVRLLEIQEQDAARVEATAERYRTLHPQGLVSRRDVDVADDAATLARTKTENTRARIAEADHVSVEAEATLRLAMLPPAPLGGDRATAEVLEYRGAGRWSLAQASSLERFFQQRFGRRLPVSALGQTATHDHLGFDHRDALDVAVHPDSVEGHALLAHLRAHRVPFLAFRGAVVGASTGAHVHVGAPSPRKI